MGILLAILLNSCWIIRDDFNYANRCDQMEAIYYPDNAWAFIELIDED